ncbi:hypothetical protein HPP92_008940 [Vanilla planifolia]|uniref:Uncharacterized protein n=1 Tax=Vanilla planifolia TaxID=51239 RepID=A0A835R7A2_VANPL|nr:hypothetical protein HPP92_008940 [Vanilla planifolia]
MASIRSKALAFLAIACVAAALSSGSPLPPTHPRLPRHLEPLSPRLQFAAVLLSSAAFFGVFRG